VGGRARDRTHTRRPMFERAHAHTRERAIYRFTCGAMPVHIALRRFRREISRAGRRRDARRGASTGDPRRTGALYPSRSRRRASLGGVVRRRWRRRRPERDGRKSARKSAAGRARRGRGATGPAWRAGSLTAPAAAYHVPRVGDGRRARTPAPTDVQHGNRAHTRLIQISTPSRTLIIPPKTITNMATASPPRHSRPQARHPRRRLDRGNSRARSANVARRLFPRDDRRDDERRIFLFPLERYPAGYSIVVSTPGVSGRSTSLSATYRFRYESLRILTSISRPRGHLADSRTREYCWV